MAKKKSAASTPATPATPTAPAINNPFPSGDARAAPKLGDDVAFYDSRYARNDLPRLGKVVEVLPNGSLHLKVFARPSLDVAVFGTEHHVLNVEFKGIKGLQGVKPTGQVATWLPD